MNQSTKTLLCLGLLGLVSAQSSVVSLFIPGADRQSLVGSIMGNDATATTYSITCPASADECGMGPGITYTGGPKTAAYTMSEPDFTLVYKCSIGGTTTVVCTSSAGGSGANFPGVGTNSASHVPLMPVTITAGSVTGVPNPASPSPASPNPATPNPASPNPASPNPASPNPATPNPATPNPASPTPANPAGASTGGLPAVTGNVGLIGGVAIAVAAAIL